MSCISAFMSSSGWKALLASSKTVRPRVGEAVLGQVADGQPRRLDDGARVGLLEAGQHLEQRGLAGAVRAAQADAVAVANLPGDVFEEGPDPEGLGDVCELNQGLIRFYTARGGVTTNGPMS